MEAAVDLKDIKAIIDLMRKNSICEFELEKEGFKIRLKRGPNGPNAGAQADEQVGPNAGIGHFPPSQPVQPMVQLPKPLQPSEIDIKSPMIGTFYRAPSPEAEPYVDVGSEVNPDTVVCIIEAMKVMNEIRAEVHGVVTQVLVENGKPVEFGQPLFKIRPAE
ncbi:MAG: acetyl-CoA carboxylase biotin carboxyl carrier protein [Verrucomicrobiota bacterium]|nr:acetyl-CoA carboxylase biotin carboxyl carrier protein [Verrucomicrobiota bacterium]